MQIVGHAESTVPVILDDEHCLDSTVVCIQKSRNIHTCMYMYVHIHGLCWCDWPSLRQTVITDGLVAADSSSSLQSLSADWKMKDWAGRCCWTSGLWYTCTQRTTHFSVRTPGLRSGYMTLIEHMVNIVAWPPAVPRGLAPVATSPGQPRWSVTASASGTGHQWTRQQLQCLLLTAERSVHTQR